MLPDGWYYSMRDYAPGPVYIERGRGLYIYGGWQVSRVYEQGWEVDQEIRALLRPMTKLQIRVFAWKGYY